MQEQKVSIVHIFNHLAPSPHPSPIGMGVVQTIDSNAVFLTQHNVEYIILDSLSGAEENILLENISKIPSYQNKKLEYIKYRGFTSVQVLVQNLKEIFLTGAKIASHPNIFFIFNDQELNINNIFEVEKSAPLLQKQDLNFFKQNVQENFNPKNFRLHMKKNKNIFDRIKLLFV